MVILRAQHAALPRLNCRAVLQQTAAPAHILLHSTMWAKSNTPPTPAP